MAFSYVGSRGSNSTKSAGTTLAATVTNDIAVGALVIVRAATDNNTTTPGADTSMSVTDSQSNVYTRLAEWTQTAGGAGDGVSVGLFYSVLTTGLTGSSDTITLTSNNIVCRALCVEEFSTAGLSGVTSPGGGAGTSQSPAASVAGLDSGSYLFIGASAWEYYYYSTWTQDADFSSFDTGSIGTEGGGPTGNVGGNGGYRIVTGTGESFDPGIGNSADWACVIVGLYEASGPPAVTGTATVTAQPATVSITGDYTPQAVSGTVAVTAQPATVAITGDYTPPDVTGTAEVTAEAAQVSITGTTGLPARTGTIAVTAQPASIAATGTYTPVAVTGTAAAVAQAATVAASGTVESAAVTGTGTVVAQAAQVSATGTYTPVAISGTVEVTAQAATIAATGYHTLGSAGVAAVTAQAAVMAATGSVTAPAVTGTVALVAQPATAAGLATLAFRAAIALTAQPATASGSGAIIVRAVVAVTAQPVAVSGSGALAFRAGSTVVTAQPAQATASGLVRNYVTGQADLVAQTATVSIQGRMLTGAITGVVAVVAESAYVMILGYVGELRDDYALAVGTVIRASSSKSTTIRGSITLKTEVKVQG